jgi:hypothetical protein
MAAVTMVMLPPIKSPDLSTVGAAEIMGDFIVSASEDFSKKDGVVSPLREISSAGEESSKSSKPRDAISEMTDAADSKVIDVAAAEIIDQSEAPAKSILKSRSTPPSVIGQSSCF